MNISYTKRIGIRVICAYLRMVAYGMGGGAARAGAQNAAADEEQRQRVTASLHADPCFYHERVKVSVEKGVVVLHDNLSIMQGANR
jgi:osmotically-inducible protein OsmY